MKRLRYILWAFVAVIEAELHPGMCMHENPNADECAKNCSCGYALCTYPEGHPGYHGNDFNATWY